MSTTGASTPRPTNAERAAALLAAVGDFHRRATARRFTVPPQLAWIEKRFPVPYGLTEAGVRALEQDPSTDIPRDGARRGTKGSAA